LKKVLALLQVDGGRREGLVLASVIIVVREIGSGIGWEVLRNPGRDFL